MATQDNRPLETLSPEEARQLIVDLRAQQAELETQNETLRKSMAEKALHENEGKLHAIIQGSPIPAFAIGKDHKIIHWNKALSKLSGIKAERVVGTKQQWRAFYSEARPCLADLLVDGAIDVIADWYAGKYIPSELVADAYEATDFFPALGEGGKWLRFTAAAVRDQHGEMIGAFETLEDVSDRMQAEEAQRSKINAQRTLAEANLRIEKILNAVHDGLWENDFQKGVFQFSNRMFTMLGYPPMNGVEGFEFLSGKMHPDDKKAFEHEHEQMVNDRIPTWATTFRMQAADGSWRYILSRGNCTSRDKQGKGYRFAGTHTDITEQRLAEESLALEKTFIDAIFNSVPGMLYLYDAEKSKIARWNKKHELMTGYTSEEISHMHLLDWFKGDAESQKAVIEGVKTTILKGFGEAEADLQKKDGARVPMYFTASPLTIHGRQYFTGLGIDITERRRAEQSLRESEEKRHQLQKAESLSRIAGAVAHRYNNLMAIVMGNLEMTMADSPHQSCSPAPLIEAMSAARRVSELGGLMLAYLGEEIVPREPLDISEVCREHLPNLRASLPENVTLNAALSAPGLVVNANADQVRQIMGSLVVNARDAMGERLGVISLNLRMVSPSGIRVSRCFPIAFQPDAARYACLEVMDDGSGIAETDIEKIFDPFYSTRFMGRGLGLSVVLGHVKYHGGCITVESDSGRGSVFRVYLPLMEEIEAGAAVHRPKARARETRATLDGCTVLVVEDEEALRRMAVAMLGRLGMTALEAKDGIDAVDVFRQHIDEIRLVLCDLTMPRMSGWETLAALRKLSPGIPVILTSGYDQTHAMEGDHAEWPHVFMGKPYGMAILKEILEKVMKGK